MIVEDAASQDEDENDEEEKEEKADLADEKYPFGADISGYVRPDGFEPEVAVLCPNCCYRRAWAEEAEYGEPLDEESYDALVDMGVFCEACRRFASEWHIQ